MTPEEAIARWGEERRKDPPSSPYGRVYASNLCERGDALVALLAILSKAARDLLALKDGARDDAYRAAKEPAWQALRDALGDES